MSYEVDRATRWAIESILKWTENAEQAHEVALALASLDWQQVILQQHQKEISDKMLVMKTFILWWEGGGNFCDDCEISQRSNYVGGYHYGPQYPKVYAWPHCVSPYDHLSIDVSAKRYCWKHFLKMQDSTYDILFRKYSDEHPGFMGYLRWNAKMTDCNNCGRLFPNRAGYSFAFAPYKSYCLHCVESVAGRQFITCLACGKKTASYTGQYCYDCHMINYRGSFVSLHRARAEKVGLPATLTDREWAKTLEYFGKTCAYCRKRPFQVLEHFIPLSCGIGGTTKENCVPACNSCNGRKGSVHPDKLNGTFPIHTIEHIKNYLEGKNLDNKVFTSPCRELVVV